MPVLSELAESTPIGTWAFSVDSKCLPSLKAFVDLFVLFFHLGIYRSLHLRQRAIETMPTPWVSCGIMMSRDPMNACGPPRPLRSRRICPWRPLQHCLSSVIHPPLPSQPQHLFPPSFVSTAAVPAALCCCRNATLLCRARLVCTCSVGPHSVAACFCHSFS